MKTPITEQIEEAERILSSLLKLREEGVEFDQGPPLETRLNRVEGMVLTLTFIQTYENEFRQFMRQRSRSE